MVEFNKKQFANKVKNCLNTKNSTERQPFFDFLTIITLINLCRLNNKNASNIWAESAIKHSYVIYRIPIVLNSYHNDAATAYYSTISNPNILFMDCLKGDFANIAKQLNPIKKYLDDLSNPIRTLGLDFLADDIDKLVAYYLNPKQDKTFPLTISRINAYHKQLSDAVFATPQLLKKALFKGIQSKFVRALIVGEGGAGKTTLYQLLTNKSVENNHKASIECNYESRTEKEVEIEYWDFAGQTQYYGLHQAFFSENCLFIVVVDSRHQQSPYHWLQQIESFTKKNRKIPVLVLVNIYENCPNQLNINDIRNRFKHLELVFKELELSNYYDKKLEDILNDTTVDGHKTLNDFYSTLITTTKNTQHTVTESIEAFRIKLKKMFKNQKIIEKNEVNMPDEDEIENIQDLDKLIKILGIAIPFNSHHDDYWIDTQWINSGGYHLLNSLQKNNKDKPSFSIQQIKNAVSTDTDHKKLLDVLIHYDLAIKQKNNTYLFPSILPTNDPELAIDLTNNQQYTHYSTFSLHIGYMPMGLFGQWISTWLNKKENDEENDVDTYSIEYSRYCCIFEHEEVYLCLQWHAYFKTLNFGFYHKKDSQKNKDTVNEAFSELLKLALQPTFDRKDIVESNITIGSELPTKKTLATFINQLKEIKEEGCIGHFHNLEGNMTTNNSNTNNYNINVDNSKNEIGKNGTINKNQGNKNTIENCLSINTKDKDKENYTNALDKLLTEYKKQERDSLKQENAEKIIQAAKEDIKSNKKLSKEKVSVFTQIAEASKKGTCIVKFMTSLIGFYASITGLL